MKFINLLFFSPLDHILHVLFQDESVSYFREINHPNSGRVKIIARFISSINVDKL